MKLGMFSKIIINIEVGDNNQNALYKINSGYWTESNMYIAVCSKTVEEVVTLPL